MAKSNPMHHDLTPAAIALLSDKSNSRAVLCAALAAAHAEVKELRLQASVAKATPPATWPEAPTRPAYQRKPFTRSPHLEAARQLAMKTGQVVRVATH